MKLEKDRLKAKVENLESNLSQLKNDGEPPRGDTTAHSAFGDSPTKTQVSALSKGSPGKNSSITKLQAMSQEASVVRKETYIPATDPVNPFLDAEFEPMNVHASNVKSAEAHAAAITCVAYHPKKDIIATGSDDCCWKLFSVPSGDNIMQGEGHADWIGGLSFHPVGNFLATASGDGLVKIWNFAT